MCKFSGCEKRSGGRPKIGGTTQPDPSRAAMTPPESLLVGFCLIDDQWRVPRLGRPRRRGPEPTRSDAAIITIEIHGEAGGPDSDQAKSPPRPPRPPRRVP